MIKMKNSILIKTLSTVLLFSGVSMANQGGSSTAQFLKIGQGARAEGMGGAFSAIADEARAVYWNPAGLAQVTRKQIAFDHLEFIEKIKTESLAGAYPVNALNGTLGVGITYVNMGSIDRLDQNGNSVSGETKVDASAATLSWGQAIGDRLALGAGVKSINQNLAGEKGSGFAADLGTIFFLIPDKLSLGASILNLGPQLKTGTRNEDLPRTLQGGAALYVVPEQLTFSADVSKERDTSASLHLGAEYTYMKMFILRAGYQDTKESKGGLSAGAGFVWKPHSENANKFSPSKSESFEGDQAIELRIDYAYVDYGDFDATHRFGVQIAF